ncbi:MAG: hypothetical protein ACRDGE_06480 [Candidatus Limnocylindria bacterium]
MRAARLSPPADEADPAVWLAAAERAQAMAAKQERGPYGRGVDHDFVRQLRGHARFCLRRAEELLGERPRTTSAAR